MVSETLMEVHSKMACHFPMVVRGAYSPKCPQDTPMVLFQVRSVLWHVGVGIQQRCKDPGRHLDRTDLPND